MDCFRYLFRSWEDSHQFPRMETTGNQMSSQYVKEKNNEKKNHPSENCIMVFSNAENIAKWNLISCSKNKKMVHLVYHSHFAAKKVPQAPSLFRVCSSEPWDSHHTKTRNKTTPETLKTCNQFFGSWHQKTRLQTQGVGGKHQLKNHSLKQPMEHSDYCWNIFRPLSWVINTCHLRIPNSWSSSSEATESLTSGKKIKKTSTNKKTYTTWKADGWPATPISLGLSYSPLLAIATGNLGSGDRHLLERLWYENRKCILIDTWTLRQSCVHPWKINGWNIKSWRFGSDHVPVSKWMICS